MRVLAVNKYYQLTGGGDRFFFDTNEILTNHGHEVIPFCLAYPGNRPTPYDKYFPDGVSGTAADEAGLIHKAKLFADGIYSTDAKKALSTLIQDVTPDVAHLHILHYTMSPSVIDALHERGIPVIFSLHDYRLVCVGGYLYAKGAECHECKGGQYLAAWKNRCYRGSRTQSLMGVLGNYLYEQTGLYDKVDLFTVPHEGMQNLVAEFGIDKDRIRILRNPLLLKNPLPPTSNGDYILFFGQLSRAKGVFTLIEAATRLPHIRFVLCGTGPESETLAAIIKERSLDNVEIDPNTRWNTGLQNLIAGSRMVVSPSEWPTPMEYSTLEAMALGKALVASRIGGNREIIEDGVCGLTFAPGDATSLAQAIQQLYEDPSKTERMGLQARNKVERTFSADRHYAELMEIYGEAKMRREQRRPGLSR